MQALNDNAAKDPLVKKVHDSYMGFKKNWDMGGLSEGVYHAQIRDRFERSPETRGIQVSLVAQSRLTHLLNGARMALTGKLNAVADVLDTVIDRIGRVTGWCSLAIVLVMAYNVLLRYFFRTGSVATQELEWHLMAPICMLGLSYAILKDGHVQVDIL